MKTVAFLVVSLTAITHEVQNQDDSLKQLQKLIKQLGDNDPLTREQAQKDILEFLRKELTDDSKDASPLIKEIRKGLDGKDVEVAERLKAVLSELSKERIIDENCNLFGLRWGQCEIISNGKIVIWGGMGKKKFLSTGALYDIEKKCWAKMADCPIEGRTSFVSGISGNNLIIWGGTGEKYAQYNDGAIYNMSKGTWEKIKSGQLGSQRDSLGLVLGNKLIIWGGRAGNKWNNDGAVFDIEKKEWKKIEEFPFNGYYSRIAILENNLAVWGGADKDKFYNQGALYNLEKNSWEKMADCPVEARCLFFFAPLGTKLIIWGGVSKQKDSFLDGAIYNSNENTWQKIEECPLDKRSCGVGCGKTLPLVAVTETNLILWGGSYLGQFYDDGATYNIKKNEWEKMDKSPLEARSGHVLIMADNKLVIWGGLGKGAYYKDGAIYDIGKKSWQAMKPSPLEGREHPKTEIFGKKLVIWGGFHPKRLNDGAIYDIENDSWEKIEDCPLR